MPSATLTRFVKSFLVKDVLQEATAFAPVYETTANEPQLDYKGPSAIVDVSETATVEEAFDTLLGTKVLALPVYRINERGEKVYCSIVCILDLLTYTILQPSVRKLVSTPIPPIDHAHHAEPLPDTTAARAMLQSSEFLVRPVSEAIGITPECKSLLVLSPMQSIDTLLELFSSGMHRTLVHDPANAKTSQNPSGPMREVSSAVRLISQTDLARFLVMHLPSLPSEFTSAPVSQISSCSDISVIRVPAEISALRAFAEMHNRGVPAVAVVDKDGRLVANLSASDLRGLSRERMTDLMLPVLPFLRAVHGSLPPAPFCLPPTASIERAMRGIVTGGFHRAWIVDPVDGNVVGVVSLSDIFRSVTTF